jgi:hypothetical protein
MSMACRNGQECDERAHRGERGGEEKFGHGWSLGARGCFYFSMLINLVNLSLLVSGKPCAMSEKSFYDLDYIIEINERRLEQYTTAYQKVLERLTHIILVYSGITIFLIPLVEDGALFRIRSPVFFWFLLVFLGLLIVSVAYTVRLMVPEKIVRLGFPRTYYDGIRADYEAAVKDRNIVKDLLKASYIRELQEALEIIESALRKKEELNSKAIRFALMSTAPYVICLAFHLSQGRDSVQKIEIVNPTKMSNFMDTNNVMFKKRKDNEKDSKAPKQSSNLPGIDNSLVIDSHPIYMWEGTGIAWTYDANGNKVYLK